MRRILLGLLAVVILAVGALAWRFRQEIAAFRISRQYSTEELENQLTDNDKLIGDAVNVSPDVTVRPPTEEERQALKDGELSQEDLVNRLTGVSSGGQSSANGPEGDGSEAVQVPALSEQPEEPVLSQSEYQEQLSVLIAKVYVLRERYLNELDAMEREAKEAYKALPESQRTKKRLVSLANDYLSRGLAMEEDCDDQMDEIVAEMQSLIRENNGDMSLVDTVIYSYANEKSIKKAWYMSRLEEKGLI